MENPVDAITQQLAVASVRHGGPTEVEVESSNLIRSLFEVSKGDPRLVRSTPHIVNASGKARMIRSWKMNEFKYKVQPCPFPTLARGFFTERVRPYTDESNNEEDGLSSAGSDEQKGFHRVVARGYDKFFNISEVPWTSWESMEVNTAPPYVLTLKSNGCIIFMAAISPQDVLVMSKHSMGAVKDREISHAQMGEIWVEKHLKSKGRTKEELASWLWEKKLTAVAELCDDSFEEHVLPYSQETTGLHLHGLNRNQGNFETLPTEEVDAFAHEFGFIATPTKVLQSIHEVREFMEQIEKAGKWNESAVEGFVVRTKVATPSASRSIRDAAASPPYPPGSDFFFKVKFDEPYMTYRDWREITRSLLAHKKKKDAGEVRIAKSRLRRPESHLYQKWVEKEINRDIKQFDGFAEGKGIIATRERFLKWMDTDEGQAELRKLGKVVETASSSQSKGPKRGEWERVVIVPVAVPGCGKTVLGIALSKLFVMGHTQSDDIPGKPSASKFLQTVEDCFKSYDIVFADRNNHLTKHRVEIKERVQNLDKPKSQGKKSKNRQTSPPKITTADEEFPIQPAPIKILAIKWEVKSPSGIDSYQEEEAGERAEEMFRICNDRIRQRGTNHQNLHYGSEHERVLRTFIREAQPIDRLDGGDDDEVDDALTIEVKDEDTLEEDVKKVVNRLVELVKGLKRPSDEALKAAVEAAKNYQAPKKAEEEMIKSFREFSPRYFSIDPDINLCDLIKKALASPQEEWDQDDLEEMRAFFKNLREEDRVTSNPHITIVHKSELGDEWCKAIWDMCMKLYKDINPPFFTFRLGALVEDGDIMALTVDDLDVAEGAENIEEAKSLLAEFSKTFRKKLHITVGTRDESVKPFLAQAMVYSWNSGKSGSEVKALKLKDVVAVGRVRGSYV